MGSADLWEAYDRLPSSFKAKAYKRVQILTEIRALEMAGLLKTEATQQVAHEHGISNRAVAGWQARVRDFPPSDWLPLLVPRYKGGRQKAPIDKGALRFLMDHYLGPERPSFAACYDRLVKEYAEPRGISLPCKRTLKNRIDRESGQ